MNYFFLSLKRMGTGTGKSKAGKKRTDLNKFIDIVYVIRNDEIR